MKCRIDFEVEPNTTYVYEVACLDEAYHKGFELARAMNRDGWTVTVGDHVEEFVHKGDWFALA